MAVVRCQKHNIPYNDLNPRGCPACAKEFEGDDLSGVMADLARMSRQHDSAPEEVEWIGPGIGGGNAWWDPRGWSRTAVGLSIAALGVLVLATSVLRGPAMEELYDPPQYHLQVLPLLVEPGQPITNLFAQLGSVPPRTHPEDSTLERYEWDDVVTDAQNSLVFSMTLAHPSRSWRGLAVGTRELEVRGGLALLGTIQEDALTEMMPSRQRQYLVYPSVQNRPLRTLFVAVRPPNGCFDVHATLRPQVIGLIEVDGRKMAVVGRDGIPPAWVLTQLEVVSRSAVGPKSPRVAC